MSKTASAVLPPGPRLPRSVQAALALRYAPRFAAACRRRYGSVFTLRVASLGTLVYLADPADIKTVFAGDPSVFHAGEANSMLSGLLGDSSVLVIDEDVHRDRRRLMMPPFHRDAVARQASVMAEIAAANIAQWPVGTEFAVAPKMSEITLEVILRTVIGASDPARLAALRKVMPRLLNIGPWASLAIANRDWQRRRPWRGLRRRIEEAERLL
ncbi:MAG: cytochrome P450, partial [Mycobacterium sp.]